MRRRAAFTAVGLLCALCAFQLALAAGMPAAQFAWGGRFSGALPEAYRWASVAGSAVLALAAWIVLARADVIAPGARSPAVRIGAWAFTAFLALNTLGNLMSASAAERLVMTPLSLALLACFAAVASARPAAQA